MKVPLTSYKKKQKNNLNPFRQKLRTLIKMNHQASSQNTFFFYNLIKMDFVKILKVTFSETYD